MQIVFKFDSTRLKLREVKSNKVKKPIDNVSKRNLKNPSSGQIDDCFSKMKTCMGSILSAYCINGRISIFLLHS